MRNILTTWLMIVPEQLRRTLTWDRGKGLTQDGQFKVDTGIAVDFTDPHSPWLRSSNENTNGVTLMLPELAVVETVDRFGGTVIIRSHFRSKDALESSGVLHRWPWVRLRLGLGRDVWLAAE